MTSSPIRIGFIGLSSTGWAPYSHLPYLQHTKKFEIVAVCNSSVESAKKAIDLYKLPAGTKAYGDAQDIANDPDVDLVVCSVRVDRHYPTLVPSLKAGKNIFVEWPLGKNLKEAEAMLKLSREHKVKHTAVGLQGRFSPVITTLKELLKEGKIGKVLSSSWTGQGLMLGQTQPAAVTYITDISIGGNLVTIHFGHAVDFVQEALGEFATWDALLSNQRTTIDLVDAEGNVVHKDHPKSTHDQIMLHGTLESGAVVSMSLRGDKNFKGQPAMDWRIYGSTGEIRITCSGMLLQMGYEDEKIEVYDFATDALETVAIRVPPAEAELERLPMAARNVGRVYEAIAKGETGVLCDFEGAVKRHEFIHEMYKRNNE